MAFAAAIAAMIGASPQAQVSRPRMRRAICVRTAAWSAAGSSEAIASSVFMSTISASAADG